MRIKLGSILLVSSFVAIHAMARIAVTDVRPNLDTRGDLKESRPFFALSVPNLDTTIRWYVDNLGFHLVAKHEAPDKKRGFALLELDGNLIELIQSNEARSLAQAAPETKAEYLIYGVFKAGFTVKNIEAVHTHMKSHKVEIRHDLFAIDDIPGMRSFIINDNNGNLIQFIGR